MADALASEYGWTHHYIFDQLTRAQIELYLQAIGRRYKRQSDSLEKASSGTSVNADDMTLENIISKKNFTALNDMHTIISRSPHGQT